MDTDSNILAVARQAIEEFGADAAGIMDRRADAHIRAGDVASAGFWRAVASAVRELLKGNGG